MSLKGKGIYAWILERCEGGDMAAVVSRLKQAGMTHIIPKIADGVTIDVNKNDSYLPDLVEHAHRAGIKVLGYHYVYGSRPADEANRAIAELKKLPYDGLVINAEIEYRDLVGNAVAADLYCNRIRQEFPDMLFALSTYRYPFYHRNFPYNAFLKYCQVNMPQVYWMKANGTVPYQLNRTIEAYREYTPRPIVPTGAAFAEHGWTAIAEDQRIFIQEVEKHGLSGCNWWEYWEAFHRNPELGNAITNTPFKIGEIPEVPSEPLTKLYYPCDPKWRITQRFGVNPGTYTISRGHNGVDWGIPVGNPIYCAWKGVVEVAVEQTNGYGRHVRVRHPFGVTIYGHLSRIDVRVGDVVEAKQVLGLSGGATSDPYSGMSTGPHLHFEIRQNEPVVPLVPGSHVYNAIDPMPYLVPHELPDAPEGEDYYLISLSGNLSLRSTPGVEASNVIGYVYATDPPYQSFERAKDTLNRDWYKVTRAGVTGWIAGYTQWTTITKIYAPEPEPEPEPEPPALTLEERVKRIEVHLGLE